MANKTYNVDIELGRFEFNVQAKSKADAKKKALAKLKKKSIRSLVKRTWPDNKMDIYIDEL